MKDLFEEEEESDKGDQFSEDFFEEFEENNIAVNPQNEQYEEKIYKNMKEEISDYIKTGNPSIQLEPLLDVFHRDILARIFLEKEVGLNQLSQKFLIKLLSNYERFGLQINIQLLSLLKTIRFHRSLVPLHIYSRNEEHISNLIGIILEELRKNIGKFSNLTQIIKILSELDKKITEAFNIMDIWMKNISDLEIKEIKWNEFYSFLSVLRSPPLQLLIRNNLKFKIAFFEIIQRKFFVLSSKDDFEEISFSFFVLMNFSIKFRFYSRNLKVLLEGLDLILQMNCSSTLKSSFFLMRCFAMMNKTYKENEIIEKLFKDAPKWHLEEYHVYLLLKFENLSKVFLQKGIKCENMSKVVSLIEKEILIRLKFLSKKSLTSILYKYCQLYPVDEKTQIYYQIFFIKLLYTDINKRNHQTFISFMKNLCDYGHDYRPLLKNCAPFFKEEINSIPSVEKMMILKLLGSLTPNEEFKDLISLYLNSLQEKIREVKSTKFILMLLKEAFFEPSLEPKDPIGKALREIILKRVMAIWDILSGKSNFFISVTRYDRTNEPYVTYFLQSKINSFTSQTIYFKYIADFSLIDSPSQNQIKYLKEVLAKTDIDIIKKNKDYLFQILREMNSSIVWDEKTGRQNEHIVEIVKILNVKEVIVDQYPDFLWKKFKAYINFLSFNDLNEQNVIIEFLLNHFEENVHKWSNKSKDSISDLKAHFMDFKDICSFVNIINICIISMTSVEQKFISKYVEILNVFSPAFFSFVKQDPIVLMTSYEVMTHVFHNILTVSIVMRVYNIETNENWENLFGFLVNDVIFFIIQYSF